MVKNKLECEMCHESTIVQEGATGWFLGANDGEMRQGVRGQGPFFVGNL